MIHIRFQASGTKPDEAELAPEVPGFRYADGGHSRASSFPGRITAPVLAAVAFVLRTRPQAGGRDKLLLRARNKLIKNIKNAHGYSLKCTNQSTCEALSVVKRNIIGGSCQDGASLSAEVHREGDGGKPPCQA